MITSILGDWTQWVRIRVTGRWAGRCSCGCLLLLMGSHSLGISESHHRSCRKGEEQQLWGKPHTSQNMYLSSEPRRLASANSNDRLYHPTNSFPGIFFRLTDNFSCCHWCRLTVGRLLKLECDIKSHPCQKQDNIL